MAYISKEGTLGRIIFHNEENGYTVALFSDEKESIRVAGCFNEPKEGSRYKLTGRFTNHRKYGLQFSFETYEEVVPTGQEAIREFLAARNIRGIGPKTAGLITDMFGDETLEVIKTNPEKLLCVKGIGESTLEKIKTSYSESSNFAAVSLELRRLGIQMSHTIKIYKLYGEQAVEVVKENPYCLIDDIYGMTFQKADRIAEQLGFDSESVFRVESAVKYILRIWAMNGSTLMPEEDLVSRVIKLIDASSENIREILADMVIRGALQIEFIDGIRCIYLYGYFYAEQRIAYNLQRIKNSNRNPLNSTFFLNEDIVDSENSHEAFNFLDLHGASDISLSDEQKKAIKAALSGKITIITGGPGTGKTTIINMLVSIFRKFDKKVALAAPTGRAAKRMQEATGESALTIHRLLEYIYSDDEDEMNFQRNEDNPLEEDVIIIDEASMIDIMLMDSLLRAIRDEAILIITGDVDQLPSVGAGNVLRDLIDSEYIYTARLNEIFRQEQGSMITTNAHRVNHGHMPIMDKSSHDFYIICKRSTEEIASEIKTLAGGRLFNKFEFIHTLSDIQIITPTRKAKLGSPHLNSLLQEVMNPLKEDDGLEKEEIISYGKKFRVGDKVMQLKNDYMAKWKDESDFSEGTGIFNGDMGIVQSVNKQMNSMIVNYDGRLVDYSEEMLEYVDLAYAVTVHKSQGSEFPAVIIPVWQFAPMLMTRNLLYTAITRGKKIVILIGDAGFIKTMIDNNKTDGRLTGLRYMIEKVDKIDYDSGFFQTPWF